jgi:hypothetical protein
MLTPCWSTATANTSASDGSTSSIAMASLVATIAQPGSGVIRSWLSQSERRSCAHGTAELIIDAPSAP